MQLSTNKALFEQGDKMGRIADDLDKVSFVDVQLPCVLGVILLSARPSLASNLLE